MRFKLWGTRGSIPSPLRAEDIEAKIHAALSRAAATALDLNDPNAIRAFVSSLPYPIRGTAGGDTSCLEVRSAGNLLIFDCGSGIRQLGKELMEQEFGRGKGVAHIFMTHTHWDHMLGWPFFVPGFIPGNKFYVYGVHPDLEQRFRLQQTAPHMFPIGIEDQAAKIAFIPIEEGSTITIGQTRVRNVGFTHAGDSYGYRIEDGDGSLVYATDSEYKTLDPAATEHAVEFFRDADVLIFDAMFTLPESYRKEDWGHSSAIAGADLATRAGVGKLLLFHHDPYATDEQIWSLRDQAEAYRRQHPERHACEVVVAYDGLEMELWREPRLEARTQSRRKGIAIHLRGRLVGETAPILLTAIEEAAGQDRNQPIVINMEEIFHLDQEGLAALFSARRIWHPLALTGLSSELRRTFNKVGGLDHFSIFDSVDSAIKEIIQRVQVRPGQLLRNRFKIEEQLDRSPQGDLYHASDQATRRRVTVLVICPSLGPLPTEAMMNTARIVADLRHPQIADIIQVGQDGHVRYIVMEYTPAVSIRQLLGVPARGVSAGSPGSADTHDTLTPLAPSRAVRIGAQIAQVLEHTHGRNVVHGGLSPDNVLLLDDDTIQLASYGIGRPEIKRPMSELPAHLGPLDYLAPEQLQGYGSGPASDLYALGAILYEMLTGHPSFTAAGNDQDAIRLMLRQSPVPPRRRNPGLSRSLEHVVVKLLQKSPKERYLNASAVLRVLISLEPQLQQRKLLGRDMLRQKLQRHLERVAQGQSGFVLVHGQRGVGKSQLVQSLADQPLAVQPLVNLCCELYAYEDARPYKLFVEALRPTLLELPAHRLSRLLKDLGELSRSLVTLLPDLQPGLTTFSSSDSDCSRLEEAVCKTLQLLTENGTVLLVADSLQWIDPDSLRLFKQLAQQRIPSLLIVGLYCTEELDPDHPLHDALGSLASQIDEQLNVGPLGPIDVHQMTSELNSLVSTDVGLWLYGETAGNPLYTEQVIQAYLEGPSETRSPHEHKTVTTVEDVILRRLERLPDDTLITLRQAAVLGHAFHFDTLRAALDRSEEQVLDDLDSALGAFLIHGHTTEDRYSFAHPLIREVIYAEMLDGVRKRYHWRAARALEHAGLTGPMDEKIDALAYHLPLAGERERALTYLARATRRARQLCAFDTALNYIDRALANVEELSRTAVSDDEREKRRKQRDNLLAARATLETAAGP